MFTPRYFNPRFWASRFFAKAGANPAAAPKICAVTVNNESPQAIANNVNSVEVSLCQ